jgi:hypothetical protein
MTNGGVGGDRGEAGDRGDRGDLLTLGRFRFPLTPWGLVLLVWFTVMSVWRVIGPALVSPVDFGWDAVIYARAARALLEGGNPWHAGTPDVLYAGPPPGMIPFLPFAFLPDIVTQVVWVGLSIASAFYVFRRLRLPLWWFLFPPVLLAIAAGSSALPLVALMVRGGVVAEAAAVVGRIYSAVPLLVLGKLRPLLVAAAVIAVTAPFLAWDIYLRDLPIINGLLAAQSSGGKSALAVPILIPFAIVGLLLLGRRRAAWLAVPALWPNAQEYYAVIALPIAIEVPLVTLAMATPLTPGIIAVGLFAQGVWNRMQPRKDEPGIGVS